MLPSTLFATLLLRPSGCRTEVARHCNTAEISEVRYRGLPSRGLEYRILSANVTNSTSTSVDLQILPDTGQDGGVQIVELIFESSFELIFEILEK